MSAVASRPLGTSGAYVGATAFATTAANDYRMRDVPSRAVETFVNRFGREEQTVVTDTVAARRFHDRHTSAFAEVRLGLSPKPYARRLELAVSGSYRDDEVQHGLRVTEQPAGEATVEREAYTARLRYGVDLGARVTLDYTGLVALGRERLRDSTLNLYDWRGNRLPLVNGSRAEVLARPTARDGETRTTAHRLGAEVALGGGLRLTASEFLAADRVTGEDPFGLRIRVGERLVDPQAESATYLKLISGLELGGEWLGGRLRAVAFGKHYHLDAAPVNVRANPGADRLPLVPATDGSLGFGAGVRYALAEETLAARLNYERATRLPTRRELFGDFALIGPNYALSPERSHNLNLGLRTELRGARGRRLVAEASAFLRRQEDLIRLQVLGDADAARFVNEDEVDARGLELSVDARPLRALCFRASGTYQRVAIAATEFVGEASFIGTQVPNTPRFFGSGGLTYSPTLRLGPLDDLALFYNVYAVERFSVTYVADLDAANPANVVPAQVQHDVGFSAAIPRARLLLSAQVENVTDAAVFDNFRVPKPGRTLSLKLTYRDL